MAIAPVSGGHVLYDLCRIDYPVSVLVLHGTQDDVIPYEGDDSGIPRVHDWVEAWAQRNGCEITPSSNNPYLTVIGETWKNCTGNVTLTHYSVEGGRHKWFGSAYGPGPYPEDMAPDLYVTDVIWEIFKSHPKASNVRLSAAKKEKK